MHSIELKKVVINFMIIRIYLYIRIILFDKLTNFLPGRNSDDVSYI
jgi:hypothetical protein